jgi:hypothetical protein
MPSELERQVVVEVIPKEIAGLRVNRKRTGWVSARSGCHSRVQPQGAGLAHLQRP